MGGFSWDRFSQNIGGAHREEARRGERHGSPNEARIPELQDGECQVLVLAETYQSLLNDYIALHEAVGRVVIG